jgi:hypothetical protein
MEQTRPETQLPSVRVDRSGWIVAMVALVLLFVVALQPGSFAQNGNQGERLRSHMVTGGGVASDSNGHMIAVTGMDVTGASVLYLVDTDKEHLCVYQASGGAGSTRGVRLVGARKIGLDLRLDGFNDKTTDSKGKLLPYKSLEKMFNDQGILTED